MKQWELGKDLGRRAPTLVGASMSMGGWKVGPHGGRGCSGIGVGPSRSPHHRLAGVRVQRPHASGGGGGPHSTSLKGRPHRCRIALVDLG
jgi:hypothetical protein